MAPFDTEPDDAATGWAALESRTAGPKIIRGGALRASGFLVGTGLTAGAFALLLRHLGVVDFGRFSTVVALVTIAGGLAEAGLQGTGVRLYTVATRERRRQLIGNIIGIRLVITPLAVLAAAAFGIIAGYGRTMVIGTLVAGAGAVLSVTTGTLAMPLSVRLRFGLVTLLEVGRQIVLVIALVALVLAGATLGLFFVAYLIAGVAGLLLAIAVVDRGDVAPARMRWSEWKPILREAGPLALSLAINVLYLKLLIVMSSLLTSGEQLGLFATASRVTEVLVGLPTFAVGVAFPLLAHAGASDEPRLAYALQRIGEATLLMAGLFAVVLVVGAQPIIAVFGGAGYHAAIPVLRIQAFALLGASMTQGWVLGVVAVGAQRTLVIVNLFALVFLAAVGAVLIPLLSAQGASAAAVAGETALAGATIIALVRARPALRPAWGYVPRVGAAIAAGLLCALLPAPAAIDAVVAAVAFVAVAAALRAVPVELLDALRRQAADAEATR
jgi:O-antigen/teichoic acid export membrane protein